MTQVFQNLIGNALKYCSPGEVHIRGTATRDGGMWRITVTDNGIGIDPGYHEEIFVMLRRLHTRQEYPGTGMGLAISKKHIEAAGGRIGVRSSPGNGATFWFTVAPAPTESSRTEDTPAAVDTAG
ncbi:sensor histidine kinase [Euzebya pacifica]|uniref:sensor histidine kinase n=1 Tax=Euzebya pacifica TaxID=1608957 RepID=UPI0030F70028